MTISRDAAFCGIRSVRGVPGDRCVYRDPEISVSTPSHPAYSKVLHMDICLLEIRKDPGAEVLSKG